MNQNEDYILVKDNMIVNSNGKSDLSAGKINITSNLFGNYYSLPFFNFSGTDLFFRTEEKEQMSRRERAVQYAPDYATNTSDHDGYHYYSYAADGEENSDCTNFVSQCLREGGYMEDEEWYFQKYYMPSDWKEALKDVTGLVRDGDIIGFSEDGKKIKHVGIVTRVDNNDIYYSAHSSERINWRLSNVINKYKAVYILHIKYGEGDRSCIEK